MALNVAHDAALIHRANLNIAAAVVAQFGSRASDSLIGHAIDQVRASHSVSELAGSGGMSMIVGAVETFLARTSEADRPRNLYGVEAARAAQAPGIGQHGCNYPGGVSGRRLTGDARSRGGSGSASCAQRISLIPSWDGPQRS